MRKRWLATMLGVPARAALTAAVAAAVAFAVGGFLFREQLYREQLAHEATGITASLSRLANDSSSKTLVLAPDHGWWTVDEHGKFDKWSRDLDPFLPGGLRPLPGPSVPGEVVYHTVALGPARKGTSSPLERRKLEVICASIASIAVTGPGHTINRLPGDHRIFCQIALPNRADETAATVKRFIAIGMLVTALVVGGIGWLVTRMALRPVNAISHKFAQISDLRLDQRVPVPGSRDAVAVLARTVNQALDRLQHAAQRQRRFIADASHELRSPITGLSSALEVALTYPHQTDWRQIVANAHRETTRLHTLVDDLLTLVRLDEPMAPPTREVDLAALVYEHITERQASRREGADFLADFREPAMILAHPNLIDRMLRNLLDNAARHAATMIRADISDLPGQIKLTVTNDGPPIPTCEQENIFLPFTRLDDARSRHTGGAGLGLAIVREIAAYHGGTARVADTPSGASFAVTFPATTALPGDGG